MKLSELDALEAAKELLPNDDDEGEEFSDSSSTLEDLNEAWELLEDCLEFFNKLGRKRNKRLTTNDVREIDELGQEVLAFVSQWYSSEPVESRDSTDWSDFENIKE